MELGPGEVSWLISSMYIGCISGRVLDRGVPYGQRVEKAAQRDSLRCVSVPPGEEFPLHQLVLSHGSSVGQTQPLAASRTPLSLLTLITNPYMKPPASRATMVTD